MTRLAAIGVLLALTAFVSALGLWWEAGAWQYGDMPTRGLLRTGGFALAAVACHGFAFWLRRRAP